MLKREVFEWAKKRLSDAERNLEYAERDKALMIAEGETLPISTAAYSKEVEYFKIVIKAVDAFNYDEREKITVEVMATKAAEGDAYYYELETGERLVIRENKIEGIYNPEEKPNEWKTAFIELCGCTSCSNCPAKTYCARHLAKDDRKCHEILKDFLIENKDE